jgi:hypothetical protein
MGVEPLEVEELATGGRVRKCGSNELKKSNTIRRSEMLTLKRSVERLMWYSTTACVDPEFIGPAGTAARLKCTC